MSEYRTKSDIMRDVRAGKALGNKLVSVYLPLDLIEAISRASEAMGTTKSEVVRQALLQCLPEDLLKKD